MSAITAPAIIAGAITAAAITAVAVTANTTITAAISATLAARCAA